MDATTTEPEVVAAAVPERRATAPGIGLTRGLLARGAAVAFVTLLAGLAVPYLAPDRYVMGLLLDGIIMSLLALGVGFLARHLGLISLGHTAFFGGAAYALAIATAQWGWGPLPAAVFGFAVGTALAALMGFLVVRASGMGFLMLTLALGQALYQLCVQTSARPYTGAYDGLQVPYGSTETFLGMRSDDLMNAASFWPVVWVSLIVVSLVLWLIGRARFGAILHGVRDNEERMRFSGFNTFLPRFAAFVVSGAVASLGGVLFTLNASYVSPDLLSFLNAGDSLIAVIVGGFGTLIGPIAGALLFVYAQAKFNTSGNLGLFTGIALVLVLVFLRGGVTGGIVLLSARIRSALRKRGRR
jgi:branched-chain amino acid transport system permease protein